MRKGWLIIFLFGVLAWGQGKPDAPDLAGKPPAAADDDKPVPAPPSAANVADDAPVMTIKGLCPRDASKPDKLSGAGCQTVITRAEFERIARAIQPSLSPVVKKQLVAVYPRLMIMSREAEARGLDREEYFQQMFAYARMQILTQQLTHRIQEEAGKVPDEEIGDYYNKNPNNFQEYTFERVFIPRLKQEPPPAEKPTPEAEATREKNEANEMTKLAEALRARAAKGESFAALQKEAYQSAGLKSNPPNASMGMMRRSGLPPGHEAAFALKPGEVSQVVSDAGGHYIYKMDRLNMETLADAKDEIHKLLQSQRLHAAMEKIQGPFSTEFNDAYFGAGNAASGGSGKPDVAPANPPAPKDKE